MQIMIIIIVVMLIVIVPVTGHRLLLLLAEGLRLGAADQGRRLEVGLVGGDGRGELLD